jgi:hypothetical protein
MLCTLKGLDGQSLTKLDILVKFNVEASKAGTPSSGDCVVFSKLNSVAWVLLELLTIFLQPPISLPNYMHNALPCSVLVTLEWENNQTAWRSMPFQSIVKLT